MENTTQDKKRKSKVVNELFGDVLGRVPPNSKELEEAVLGAMMLEREKVHQVIDILSEKHFYQPQNQEIFKVIRDMYLSADSAIDLLTVSNALKNQGKLEFVGGPFYLAQLTNRVSSAANIEFHARILTQKFIQRELISVAGEVAYDAYDDSKDAFELLDQSEA